MRATWCMYFISGCLSYGHFWNNPALEWELMQKLIVGLTVALSNPLYWSVVLFGM